MTSSMRLFEGDQERINTIRAIGIEVRALVFDNDEVTAANDTVAERRFYARVFQVWAENKIEGTAEQIFDTIQETLDV